MFKIARIVVFLLSLVFGRDAVAANMSFRFASDGGTGGNQWIVADGEIRTGSAFQSLLHRAFNGTL